MSLKTMSSVLFQNPEKSLDFIVKILGSGFKSNPGIPQGPGQVSVSVAFFSQCIAMVCAIFGWSLFLTKYLLSGRLCSRPQAPTYFWRVVLFVIIHGVKGWGLRGKEWLADQNRNILPKPPLSIWKIHFQLCL